MGIVCSNFRWNQQFLGNFERVHFQNFHPSFTSACKLRSTSSNRSTAICHFEDLSIALTAAWNALRYAARMVKTLADTSHPFISHEHGKYMKVPVPLTCYKMLRR